MKTSVQKRLVEPILNQSVKKLGFGVKTVIITSIIGMRVNNVFNAKDVVLGHLFEMGL